jgi:cell wall-associated NlpC family hydrolase
MKPRTQTSRLPLAAAVVAAVAAFIALVAPVACARTYRDVPSGQWARTAIDWCTDQGPDGNKMLDDYDGAAFKPDRAITRAQLGRALVIAAGHANDVLINPLDLPDTPPEHPYYTDVELAVKLGLLGRFADGFHPDQAATTVQVDKAVVRLLRRRNPSLDWTMLSSLAPARWEPNAGWKTGAPSYLPFEIAAHFLNLRYNHPAGTDAQEVSPLEPIDRDEVAYSLYQAARTSSWRLSSLSWYDSIVLPRLTAQQKRIVSLALKYVGYPYVWGGEYPTTNSPYGLQAHGGFDCSGFVWWIMKIKMHYPIPDSQRTASAMAAAAKPRITRAHLVPGDLIFFGGNGAKSTVSSIYHTGLYLGRGWFIHSSGYSANGVNLASLNWSGWSWHDDFAWGRRVLKAGEFVTP